MINEIRDSQKARFLYSFRNIMFNSMLIIFFDNMIQLFVLILQVRSIAFGFFDFCILSFRSFILVYSFWFLANKDSEKKECDERKNYIEKKKEKLKKKNTNMVVEKSIRNSTVSKKFNNKQKQRIMRNTLNNFPDNLQQKIRSSNPGKKN
jgi:hypothetical protein